MKIKFNPAASRAELEFVLGAILPRTTLPILQCVHIHGSEKSLVFTATNLDMYCSAIVAGSGDGDTVLNGRIVRAMAEHTNSDADLEVGRRATIKFDGGDTISCDALDGDEFLEPPKWGEKPAFTVSAKAFRGALEFVRHSMSTDESRYVLCGVKVEACEGGLAVIATDGRRISHAKIASEHAKVDMIVPAVAVPHLLKMLEIRTTDELTVAVGKDNATFTCGHMLVKTKLIEGNYPNWRPVLVKQEMVKSSCVVTSEDLGRAVAWASRGTTNKATGIRFEKNTVASGEETKFSTTLQAGEITQVLRADYIATIAQQFSGSGEFTWHFSGELQPAWFTDGQQHVVLMPMKIE